LIFCKIYEPKESFQLILFMMASYFSLELFASFYVDLTYFIMCAIFFASLYLFNNKPKENTWSLALIIFFMFISKNTSYILIPITSFFMIIYFFIQKKERITYIWSFIKSVISGFTAYLILILRFNFHEDLIRGTGTFISDNPKLGTILSRIFHYFIQKKIDYNFYFLQKFHSLIYIIILYVSVTYLILKKKNVFWILLFVISEFFFIFFYNIKGHHYDLRYFLLFYPVYLIIIFESLKDLTKFISKKLPNKIRVSPTTIRYMVIIIMAIINLTTLILKGTKLFSIT